MSFDYLSYRIEPLPPLKKRDKRIFISQKEAAEKYRVPALHIKWAIDAGRIDYEHSYDYKRRLVKDNRRLRDWARNHRRTLNG